MPNSNLSLKVKQLEADLGQALFSRSTRKVVITEFGQAVIEASRPIFEARKQIDALSQQAVLEPQGVLRVTAPYDIGLYLIQVVIPGFLKENKKVQVEIQLDNNFQDIISSHFDLAIRASLQPLVDSSALAIKLGESSMRFYVHKDSKLSSLKSIEDLEQLPIISMSSELRISNGMESKKILTSSRLLVRDMTGIKQATLGQMGISVLPEFLILGDQAPKALIHIFPEWTAGEATFFAIYPSNASLTPKIKAFTEFVKSRFLKIAYQVNQ